MSSKPKGGIMGQIATSDETFFDYRATYVEPHPRYVKQAINSTRWRNIKHALADDVVKGHLDHQYSIGVVGKWYPAFGVFDMDDVGYSRAEEIRSELGLDSNNSMLFETQSEGSYHLLFSPTYNKKPPTIKLFQAITAPFAKRHGIEVFPHPKKPLRLPFGVYQTGIENGIYRTDSWEKELYWFQKLDDYPLENVPGGQWEIDFQPKEPGKIISLSDYKKGDLLYQHGLQELSSRADAQFQVIYWMWRRNVSKDNCRDMVSEWVRTKHNGFSEEINQRNSDVEAHIGRQVDSLYRDFHFKATFPDTPHKGHYGYIAKGDLEKIIKATGGSIPRARFLFHLIKYAYPRRHRTFLGIHRDNLRSWAWSSDKYLKEFEGQGLLTRGKAYSVGRFSKDINLKWPFKGDSEAVLYEGRAIDSFEGTVKLLKKEPREFRAILEGAGAERTAALKATQKIYS